MQVIWQIHTPAVLPTGKNAHYPLVGRLGRPRTPLEVLKKGKVCIPCLESNNDYSVGRIVEVG